MNFFPNCAARSGVLKQTRGLRYALSNAVILNVPTYMNPAAFLSYLSQGNHLICFGFEKSGPNPSSVF